ncbi:hypothetical protein FQA39_LY08919 [Lamprigera yunnana]|nr:hypothetical protein FQA39_LY08919 [Lamprigera yunnana]
MNMGRAISALLACVLHNSGIYIFRPPTNLECFPYTAYVTFLFAVFYLLWTVPVNPFPSCFRGLVYPASLVVEFLIHVLCTELLLTDFWCPLQTKFIAFLPTIPELANDYLTNIGLDLPIVIEKLEYLKSEEALIAASYMLSIFFLLSTAHAARVVDFRLLKIEAREYLFSEQIEADIIAIPQEVDELTDQKDFGDETTT